MVLYTADRTRHIADITSGLTPIKKQKILSMKPTALLLYFEKPDSNDRNISHLIRFYGIDAQNIRIDENDSISKFSNRLARRKSPVVILSGNTLLRMIKTFGESIMNELLFKEPKYVFLHSLQPSEESSRALESVSGGIIKSIYGFEQNNLCYEVSDGCKEIVGALSGISFGPINKSLDLRFEKGKRDSGFLSMMSIGGHPFFIAMDIQGSRVFVVACRKIAGIDDRLNNSFSIREHFSTVIPSIMFIKYVFREQVWHKKIVYANLVIDDPLLKSRYGFLDFRKLLEAMDENDFTTTIAFIPWNYRRTDEAIAKLFRERSDRYGLCVHGCDHTNGEFASIDANSMMYKATLAQRRMDIHEIFSGIPYRGVMAFPHGSYSTASLKVLKGKNYCAAFHSSARPVDVDTDRFDISDYLDLAVTRYENFPLFVRRYPGNLIDTSIDVFLGKTIFFVHHHDCFRNGYDEISSAFRKVNQIHPEVRWASLDEIFSNMYRSRTGPDGTYFYRIYSNDVTIKNDSDETRECVIEKKETWNVLMKQITVNGHRTDYSIDEENVLRIVLPIKGKERARIRIRYEDDKGFVLQEDSRGTMKVLIRRTLSEFRDSYLNRNRFLTMMVNRYKKYLIDNI